MQKALEAFVQELALDAKDPFLYDELTLRCVLQEVLEAIEDPGGISEDAVACVASIESVFRRLSSEVDRVSFGVGAAWTVSVLLSDCLDRSHDRAEEARLFRCFQRHLAVLKEVEAHPLFSHADLASAIGKTSGRLSQITAELKANRLLLVDKLGRENRYELTSVAKRMLDEERFHVGGLEAGRSAPCNLSVGDVAEIWAREQDGVDGRIEMSNINVEKMRDMSHLKCRALSNAA